MTALHEGDPAPDFTLPRSGGGTLSLRDLRGKDVVLYFYPKDDTPGCTKEACGFRDSYGDIENSGAVVVGISPDTSASHDKFIDKYNLPFTLVADTDHQVAEAYGAWGERKRFGVTSMGINRSTYLIDRNGTVAKIWRSVRPDGHAGEVLAALSGRNGAQ